MRYNVCVLKTIEILGKKEVSNVNRGQILKIGRKLLKYMFQKLTVLIDIYKFNQQVLLDL